MAISRDEVENVALLGRLHLAEEEVDRFADQLSDILAYMGKLQGLDTEGIEPMAHPLPLTDVVRPDEPRPSLDPETAVAEAPDAADGMFRVPRVIDEGTGA